jgi:hypothetical protein
VPMEAAPPSSISPPASVAEPILTIPDSARSQYGSNLTPSGSIFPLVAQIIKASLPSHSKLKSPEASDSDSLLQLDFTCRSVVGGKGLSDSWQSPEAV